ncbi:MAG: WD40/YVTN/BNR-like repeat-containing protein [Candidatus Kariarchaeaceae archaeon]
MTEIKLLVGTKKGAFTISCDEHRKNWIVSDPLYLGNITYHMVQDPRGPDTILMGTTTGHLGPTIFRSTDKGNSWKEATTPPRFPKAEDGSKGKVVKSVFWLTPGHASEPEVWYAGTSPQGLFRSSDGGDTWEGVAGFNDHSDLENWTKDDATPGGPLLHSINVDPRDKNHLYLGMSLGGFFESTDRGKNWTPLNKGVIADYLPDPYPEYGQDTHNAQLHPLNPDRIYQQNHCGIYRMDRGSGEWVRIGDNMPKEIGDIGFPLVIHPRKLNTLWVFPMDGTDVWPRTSVNGEPAVYKSTDAGESWVRKDHGFPKKNAWFTVYRQSMNHDDLDPLGIYVGTTAGEIWASFDEGESWEKIVEHLPDVYSIEVARF